MRTIAAFGGQATPSAGKPAAIRLRSQCQPDGNRRTRAAIVPDDLSPTESWDNGYTLFLLAARRFINRVVQSARPESQQSPIPENP
jgi:hypothetical protein